MSDHNSLLFKQKQALRQKMLAWRKSLSASELAEISLKAQMQVLALPQWQGATQVLLYYPVNNELDTMLLIESAFEQKKQVLLPRCIAGQKGQMELAHCPDLSCLVLGQFGIMEPNPKTCPAFYPAFHSAAYSAPELPVDEAGVTVSKPAQLPVGHTSEPSFGSGGIFSTIAVLRPSCAHRIAQI